MTEKTNPKSFWLKKKFLFPVGILALAALIYFVIWPIFIKAPAPTPKLYTMVFDQQMQKNIFNDNQGTTDKVIIQVKFQWSLNGSTGDYSLIATGQYLDASNNLQDDISNQKALRNSSIFCSKVTNSLNGSEIFMTRGDIKALNGMPLSTDPLLSAGCVNDITLTPNCTASGGVCGCPAGTIIDCIGRSAAPNGRTANPHPPYQSPCISCDN